MVLDFIWASGQILSIIGLLYGAYASITYPHHKRSSPPASTPADTGARYDPITTHAWNVTSRTLEHWVKAL
jgi:hypothetical protein